MMEQKKIPISNCVALKDIQVILVTTNLHRGVDKQEQTKDAQYSTVLLLFFVESHQRETEFQFNSYCKSRGSGSRTQTLLFCPFV